ncbi:unnamed protein product [Vitrella brassicaformis CCMP3155]|uniref:Uncharacterized protein n=1 Tax=Vitrella brassicaformis (strain CCMP3155) TaxID=1169540 RepID=A0A0G4G992_VITBC|nr:unnamed protein product [Vitrella brassicaformis CCMP3155]|eukprot:CEM25399.1 unnamed protein product [Vitrella brassicaformis CCMP3155]
MDEDESDDIRFQSLQRAFDRAAEQLYERAVDKLLSIKERAEERGFQLISPVHCLLEGAHWIPHGERFEGPEEQKVRRLAEKLVCAYPSVPQGDPRYDAVEAAKFPMVDCIMQSAASYGDLALFRLVAGRMGSLGRPDHVVRAAISGGSIAVLRELVLEHGVPLPLSIMTSPPQSTQSILPLHKQVSTLTEAIQLGATMDGSTRRNPLAWEALLAYQQLLNQIQKQQTKAALRSLAAVYTATQIHPILSPFSSSAPTLGPLLIEEAPRHIQFPTLTLFGRRITIALSHAVKSVAMGTQQQQQQGNQSARGGGQPRQQGDEPTRSAAAEHAADNEATDQQRQPDGDEPSPAGDGQGQPGGGDRAVPSTADGDGGSDQTAGRPLWTVSEQLSRRLFTIGSVSSRRVSLWDVVEKARHEEAAKHRLTIDERAGSDTSFEWTEVGYVDNGQFVSLGLDTAIIPSQPTLGATADGASAPHDEPPSSSSSVEMMRGQPSAPAVSHDETPAGPSSTGVSDDGPGPAPPPPVTPSPSAASGGAQPSASSSASAQGPSFWGWIRGWNPSPAYTGVPQAAAAPASSDDVPGAERRRQPCGVIMQAGEPDRRADRAGR